MSPSRRQRCLRVWQPRSRSTSTERARPSRTRSTQWFADYATSTGIKINYQSIGSGGGIRQLSEQTVDFGASDSPMSDQELANAKGGPFSASTPSWARSPDTTFFTRQQAAEP